MKQHSRVAQAVDLEKEVKKMKQIHEFAWDMHLSPVLRI